MIKQLKAQFDENGELQMFQCSKCKHISFKRRCWTCLNHNKFPEQKIITLIRKEEI